MAKCFMFEVPEEFTRSQIIELKNFIGKQAFIELRTYADETHFEFLFENDNLTEEKISKIFKLSEKIKVRDTSNWCH